MKAKALGIVLVVLSVLLILTPRYMFPVCGVGRNAPPGETTGSHACHGTLKAETALGSVAILIGVLPILWPRRKPVLCASVSSFIIAALAALFPLVITGMCKMPTMPCNQGTRPAFIVISVLFCIAAAAGSFVYRNTP